MWPMSTTGVTRPRSLRSVGTTITTTASIALLAVGAAVAISRPAHAAEVSPPAANGSWTVDARGNGHGHGLSQYGARGAAIAGLSAAQIISFYYPGTSLVTARPINIRVFISDVPTYTTVAASTVGLAVTGRGALPTAGVSRYRLVPSGSVFSLQKQVQGVWSVVGSEPAQADFTSTAGVVRTFHADGSYSDYRGSVGGLRSGAGQLTVNRLDLDSYVRGVVPREMPSSWQPAAVQAQTIAVRSYARYAVEHDAAQPYDICASTNCQVYGGLATYSAANVRLYGEEAASNAAVAATANKVATWAGRTIFAQFSASNGGMMAAGGQPYLVTKPDPYDNAASGDPYLSYTRVATQAQVAGYYGLASVSEISVTARAGGGLWGGIVTAGVVTGRSRAGAAVSVAATGPGLASALGVGYQYFKIESAAPLGRLDQASMTGVHTLRLRGWAMDPAHTGVSTAVRITVGASNLVVAATRSRPDVQTAYRTTFAAYGYDTTVTLPPGVTRVCVSALTVDRAAATSLRCVSETIGVNPGGHVDSLTKVSAGHYRIAGWAFDPDANGGSTRVDVYVDQKGYALPATLPRPDVARAYLLSNDRVGFSAVLPVPAGAHRVCAYAINTVGPGTNKQIRCLPVTS
jgi:peptidoglycan hydrolase-like amidase